MTVKTWVIEAETIAYGRLMMWRSGDFLFWQRDYHFEDAEGQVIQSPTAGGELGAGDVMTGQMAWADVPQDVKDALATMDNYTKNQIAQKEGIA